MKHVALVAFVAIAAATSLMTGCSSVAGPDDLLDVRLTLSVGTTTAVPGGGMAVRFDAVPSDSRCPAAAFCIWAGAATVRLALLRGGHESSFELRTDPDAARRATVDGVGFELVQLDPYPVTVEPIPPDRYRLTIRIVYPSPL